MIDKYYFHFVNYNKKPLFLFKKKGNLKEKEFINSLDLEECFKKDSDTMEDLLICFDMELLISNPSKFELYANIKENIFFLKKSLYSYNIRFETKKVIQFLNDNKNIYILFSL